MSEAIGIRLDTKFIEKIEKISKEEVSDRSGTIRKLLEMGYKEFIKNKASEEYIKGKVTISEAARRAELTVWEMQKHLVDQGFKSNYSIEDLDRELKMLESIDKVK